MPRSATAEDQRRALEIACRRAKMPLEDLWMHYFTLGGDCGLVEVEAYLHGLMPLPVDQRDILAHAVNERLDDMTTRLRVPYARVVRRPPTQDGVLAGLIGLLEGMEQGPPERLVEELDAAASALDLEVTVYLVDYAQSVLIPLRADPDRPRTFISGSPVPIESTLAGRAYQRVQIFAGDAGDRAQLWVPLLDGTERLGVLGFRLSAADDPHDPQLRRECRWLSALLGHLITASTRFGDALDTVRRLQPRTNSAELAWGLLPPLTAGSDRFMVAGQFEPSSGIGGDSFDYAVSEERVHLSIFDSTGHSFQSGLVTATALAASRNARRNGGGLFAQSMAIDEAVSAQFGGQGLYITAVLADLDLRTGRLRYLNAGHPAPLLLRAGKVVKALDGGRRPLFGVRAQAVSVSEEVLQPGDSLLLYSDGIIEARDESGEFFGIERLKTFLQRASAAGFPPPETVRRLIGSVMRHQQGALQDDATVLLSTWLSGNPRSSRAGHEREPWY